MYSVPDVSTYSLDDLHRLITLTLFTVEAGEYVLDSDGEVLLRTTLDHTEDGALVNANGETYWLPETPSKLGEPLVCRVMGFRDASGDVVFRDPMRSVLQRELKRRTQISNVTHAGRRVQVTTYRADGLGDPTVFTAIIGRPVQAMVTEKNPSGHPFYPHPPANSVWMVDDTTGAIRTVSPDKCTLL